MAEEAPKSTGVQDLIARIRDEGVQSGKQEAELMLPITPANCDPCDPDDELTDFTEAAPPLLCTINIGCVRPRRASSSSRARR